MHIAQVLSGALTIFVIALVQVQPVLAAPVGGNRWVLSREVDKLDGSVTIGIQERAFETTISKPRRSEITDKTGHLIISCDNKETVFVFQVPGELVASYAPVISYRIDRSPPVKNLRWSSTRDNTGVGMWKSRQSVSFLKKLMEGQDFFIRVEENVFGTTEASFNLAEIKEAIKPVREACRW